MSWRPLLPSGFVTSFHLTGLTATKNGLRRTACQKAKPSDNGMPNRWEQMGSIYFKHSIVRPPHHGYEKSPWFKHSARCGCNSMMQPKGQSNGELRRILPQV